MASRGVLRNLVLPALLVAVPTALQAAPGVFTFPPGGIIQWAAVSDQTPCAGRPVLVVVATQHPTNPGAPVEVYVDGDPGVPQFVQYFGPNPQKKIPLFAITREGQTDKQEITIDVQACPAQTQTLHLLQHKNPFHPNRVDFRAMLKGRRARAYQWTFGDGQQAVTTEPFVSHDYSGSVKPRDKYSYFTATVRESSSGLLSGKRIALGSSFDLSRSMGFVQAEVKMAVTQTGQGFVVGLDILNHHKTPVQFNRYFKQYLPCDTRKHPQVEDVTAEAVFGTGVTVTRPAGTLAPGEVTIAGGREAKGRLVLSLERVPEETCALGFNLIGQSTDRRPVYASFYLAVRRNARATRDVVDSKTLTALKTLRQQNLLPSNQKVTGEDLYLLEQRGFIERTKTGWRRTQ